jgi:hypothetical protein
MCGSLVWRFEDLFSELSKCGSNFPLGQGLIK